MLSDNLIMNESPSHSDLFQLFLFVYLHVHVYVLCIHAWYWSMYKYSKSHVRMYIRTVHTVQGYTVYALIFAGCIFCGFGF